MKLPSNGKKFIFLLAAITIVVALEILSIIGMHLPMPYLSFIYAIVADVVVIMIVFLTSLQLMEYGE